VTPVEEKSLLKLYKDRLKDRKKAKTRRFQKIEAGPQNMADVLGDFFKKDPERYRKIQQTKAMMAWPEIVGAVAAQFSKPIKIRGAQMVVQVSEPIWAQQLILLKYSILKKYRKRFPRLGLKDLFIVRK